MIVFPFAYNPEFLVCIDRIILLFFSIREELGEEGVSARSQGEPMASSHFCLPKAQNVLGKER